MAGPKPATDSPVAGPKPVPSILESAPADQPVVPAKPSADAFPGAVEVKYRPLDDTVREEVRDELNSMQPVLHNCELINLTKFGSRSTDSHDS